MTTKITAARRRELAGLHGLNEQYLYQCLTGRRDMGPVEAVRLEIETRGELTRQMLCQKTFPGIWPELIALAKPSDSWIGTDRRITDRRSKVRRAEDRQAS